MAAKRGQWLSNFCQPPSRVDGDAGGRRAQGTRKAIESQGRCCGTLPLCHPSAHQICSDVLCVAQGLLLDCDAATLTVYVNGERKGVMVEPGTGAVARLEGPLRWVVDMHQATVAIDGPLPAPAV